MLKGTKTKTGTGIVHYAICRICGRKYKQTLSKKDDEGNQYWIPRYQCGAHLKGLKKSA